MANEIISASFQTEVEALAESIVYLPEGEHEIHATVNGKAAKRKVTVDGQTYALKPPFLVVATQNPVDQEGTFPLPEAQLDRFLVRLSLGYPSMEDEFRLLGRLRKTHPIDELQPVISVADWLALQEAVKVRESLRAEVAMLAVKGAEQILRKEVNAQVHSDLLTRLKSEL